MVFVRCLDGRGGFLDVAAAADTRPEARARFAADFGGTAYDDVAALCADETLDAIYVATPHQFHADHAVLAARAGKHVLVEKPMALTLEDCTRMIDAAAAAGVFLLVGHSHSYDAPVAETRRLIAVPGSERRDEIGDAARSFGDLTGEIHRHVLELKDARARAEAASAAKAAHGANRHGTNCGGAGGGTYGVIGGVVGTRVSGGAAAGMIMAGGGHMTGAAGAAAGVAAVAQRATCMEVAVCWKAAHAGGATAHAGAAGEAGGAAGAAGAAGVEMGCDGGACCDAGLRLGLRRRFAAGVWRRPPGRPRFPYHGAALWRPVETGGTVRSPVGAIPGGQS